MRKLLIVLACICTAQIAYAQRSVYDTHPQRLYNQGREMFLNNNYSGTVNTLREFVDHSKDTQLNEEAEFMILASDYYMGTPGIGNKLKGYMEQYPGTIHRSQLSLYIGSIHFQEKDWDKTLYWLSQADLDHLNVAEQEDYTYRMAYSSLQIGKYKEKAKQMFGMLERNSDKYREPASYYYAYLDFQDGNYKEAAAVFRKLQSKPEYKENASFYLIQSSFLDGNIDETISTGKAYVSEYPKSDNAPEVYRLLGNCYYKRGDLVNSVLNYERFLQSGNEVFREDMYQLADAYYQNNTYQQAIGALKMVASNDDLLGQAGYMLLGQCYLKTGSDANALMAFDAASHATFNRSISEDALYNYVLLVSKGSVSAFDESIDAFQRFLNEYPNSKYSGEINNLLANTLLSTKNYAAALNAIARIKSPNQKILEAKQMILTQQGIQEYINNDYTKALNDFNAAIAMGTYNKEASDEAYFWRGEIYYNQGDYSAAVRDYSSYISTASTSQQNYALALYNLGYCYFQQKNYTQAATFFKRYTSSEKNKNTKTYADALNRIGDTYLHNRNYREAEAYYTQAVGANPGSGDYAEFQKALVKGLQRDHRGKITILNDMMAKYPDSQYYDSALMEKSKAYVALNNESDAIPVLEKLLREYPRSAIAPQAGVLLGQLYFNTDNPQKSIAAYKQVISTYPNTEEARISIKSLEGVYKEVNDISGYANYMNSLGGNYKVSASRQDSLTYLAAEALYLKGQTTQAKSALGKYLQAYPNGGYSGEANYNLGLMAFEAKDHQTALPYFREAIKANNPKYMDDALIYASGIEFDNKDYDAAYSTYEHLSQAGTTADNRGIGQLGMLRCAYLTNKDQEVIDAADKVLANSKLSASITNEARFYRGRSLNRVGRFDEAIKDLTEVGEDTRNAFGAESQYILAQIYYDRGMYDTAEKQVTGFMQKGTPHQYWMARSLIVLADSYAAKGDYFQARQYLESLNTNYKGGEADIRQMVEERMTNLENK
ncbi:tetratricopeptide repeat protein [Dysgonomonas sp. 25]|uniref:tetratricopeptide repeat protein n=1 Tax=Dysgonomonas sp. 25 TaxID=2302933 RepID=UPI0013CF8039|nr:tetratricopeptide repeat protein [Dysgonomonas sp. 25]NDV68777.1 outer membrane protein assembly factor BamD [Dysgonomonas sp. 25]